VSYFLSVNKEAKNIGKNIRAFRLAKGWTQHDLAEKLGSTQKTITAYERGTRHPTAEKIPKIAGIFNVTVNELYGIAFTKKTGKDKNPKLWKRFEQIDKLPQSEKSAVIKMLDAMIDRNKKE
jgi:transcriptional regulator with XRE-family HTH domain